LVSISFWTLPLDAAPEELAESELELPELLEEEPVLLLALLEEITLPSSLEGDSAGPPPQAVTARVRATTRIRQIRVRGED